MSLHDHQTVPAEVDVPAPLPGSGTCSKPSFAYLSRRLDLDLTLSPTRRRDLKSGLSSLARILNMHPASIPADPTWLRLRLKGFHPAQSHMSSQRYADIKGYALAALRHCGLAPKLGPSKVLLSDDWARLWNLLDDRIRWPMSRFVRFCSTNRIPPEAVDDSTVRAFRRHLDTETMADDPHYLSRRTITLWNRCRKTVSGWPQQALRQLERRGTPWTYPLTAFPVSLQREVDEWAIRVLGDDPLAEHAIDRPLDRSTVKTRVFHIRMMASALVRRGHPIQAVTGLAYLVQPEHFREALAWLFERRGKERSEYLLGVATGLKAIAKHHVRLPESEIAELTRICVRLRPKHKQRGLTAKNRQRVHQLDDERAKFDLLNLPSKIVRRVVRAGVPTRKLAADLQIAVAIEILIFAPIRIGNLASLEIDRHLIWSRPGRKGTLTIAIDGADVKNGENLEHELPEESARLITLYLKNFQPLLFSPPSSFMFPGRYGSHKASSQLSSQVKQVILAGTGLVLSAHNFRHGGSKIFLDERPGMFEVVRRVLGHRESSTVLDHYIGTSQKAATRQFDAEILKVRRRDPPDRRS